MSSPHTPPVLLAPGASGAAMYAPGRGAPLPAVDDRLVAPESRAEIVDGTVYQTMGSNQPHGTRHFAATHVFAGTLADGYEGAVDMLTRADENSDAAPDISVFPSGEDEVTGGRKLEEIAFEVLDTERLGHATTKVEKFAARGVRRLFAIRVASRKVYEWDHAHADWIELGATSEIVDRCFRVPVPVAAFVDRVLADDTVARALLAAKNRVLAQALLEQRKEGQKEGRKEGQKEGERAGELRATRAMLLTVLEARGTVTAAQRARVMACEGVSELQAWTKRVAAGEAVDAVLEAG